jgi:hypothetical protein
MHPSLRLVERFEELLQRRQDDTPYDYPTLFSTDGYFTRRASKRRFRLLLKIDERLREVLRPAERVRFLTSGVLYSFWESYLFGLPMYYLNRRALVVTSERLILLQIDSRQNPRELCSQVPLDAIDRVKKSFFGNTALRLLSGKSYAIAYVPRRDRNTLVQTIQSTHSSVRGQAAAAALQHLCPHCYQVLEGYPTQCGLCGGALKSSTRAGLLSLVFPGLGDIYIGHARFAIFEMIVVSLIWLGIFLPDPQVPTTLGERLVGGVFVIAIVHGIDAIATRHVARKGHYPAGERRLRGVTAGKATAR